MCPALPVERAARRFRQGNARRASIPLIAGMSPDILSPADGVKVDKQLCHDGVPDII
jgi:hypothetical protein